MVEQGDLSGHIRMLGPQANVSVIVLRKTEDLKLDTQLTSWPETGELKWIYQEAPTMVWRDTVDVGGHILQILPSGDVSFVPLEVEDMPRQFRVLLEGLHPKEVTVWSDNGEHRVKCRTTIGETVIVVEHGTEGRIHVRRLTGEGQYVKLSLADVAFATVGNLGYIGEVQINHEERPNLGNSVYGSYGADFATSDGRRVMIIAVSVSQWKKLVEATETDDAMTRLEADLDLDFMLEEHRFAAREPIGELIGAWCGAHTLAEARAAFDANNVCWGPYQTFTQMVEEDPRCTPDNPLFREVEQPGIGNYLMPGAPYQFGAVERSHPRGPLLGEHTDEILASDLGLSDGEIGKLHDRGIVAGAE